MKKLPFVIAILIGLISCSPDSPEISQPEPQNFDFEVLFENNKEAGINIFYLGDAYLESDLDRQNGVYRQQAIQNINAFFSTHPFSAFTDDFNAYIVYVPSESDVILSEGEISPTAFGAHFSEGGSLLVIEFESRINLIVKEITGRFKTDNDLVLMSVNNASGGSARLNGGLAVFGQGNTAVMMHEVGHAFAGLADEYTNPIRPPLNVAGIENLDNINNLERIKWNRFIGLDGYEDVGAFEGGGYTATGIWRPEENSLMKSLGELYFNAPSRDVIVRRICEKMNKSCSFEDFLELDQTRSDRLPIKVSETTSLQHFNCVRN
jgi:hypothetical protein